MTLFAVMVIASVIIIGFSPFMIMGIERLLHREISDDSFGLIITFVFFGVLTTDGIIFGLSKWG